MSSETTGHAAHNRQAALEILTASAASNIPGVDFASITVRDKQKHLSTITSTDPVAERVDALQYELREGPCYAAVNDERLVLINDLAADTQFPRFGRRASEMGIGAQAAIQLVHNGEQAGLNLYSRRAGVFDRATVQLAELFATPAAALLEYAIQVEQLDEALHTRTDIGIAIGIVMERYGVDRHQAFAFLTRNSQSRNIKVRLLAQQIIDGAFRTTDADDA